MPKAIWYGDYYGVLSLRGEQGPRPERAAGLGRPAQADEYKNTVALAGDPRASNQAIQGVYAAGLSKGGAAGEAAGKAGLEFFKELNAKGNFVPVIGKAATLAQGQTPILITWDYNALAGRDTLNGNPPVEVVVPKTGVVAGVYVQAISAFAPHPNAAKLWMEYLYSDEGQLGWLKGYCHPIRFNDLAKQGRDPAGAARQAAAGRSLRQGGLPDPRRAGRRQGSDHQAVGRRRRRQRPVSLASAGRHQRRPAASLPTGSRHHDRITAFPEPAVAGEQPRRLRRAAAAADAMAGRRAVLHLRADVPDPADA